MTRQFALGLSGGGSAEGDLHNDLREAAHPSGPSDPPTREPSGTARRLVQGCLGGLLLAAGLILPWISSAMGLRADARQLSLRLPGWTWLDSVSYAFPVSLAITLVVAGIVVEATTATGRRQSRGHRAATALFRTAGAVAAIAALGFFLQLMLTDARTTAALQADHDDFTLLSSQLGYRVPQPQFTQFLFIHLSPAQALVVSAMRSGWYATVLGGLVVALVPRASASRSRPEQRSSWERVPASAAIVLVAAVFLIGLVRGAVADRAASEASSLAATGRYSAAAARYADAASLNPELVFEASFAAGSGRAQSQVGKSGHRAVDRSAVSYALGLDEFTAGRYQQAVATLSTARKLDPGNPLLAHALTTTAVQMALKAKDPSGLQAGPAFTDSALLRFTRGRLEVATGQLSAGVADLLAVGPLTRNADIKSAALTYAAIAQQDAGDMLAARTTLEAALALDTGHYNVVASALALGLYSGMRS